MLMNAFLTLQAQKSGLSAITRENLRSYMTFFASDEMQGRKAGTFSNDAAALYIGSNLIRIGVSMPAATGTYYQEVPMQRVEAKSILSVRNQEEVYETDSIVLLGMPFMSMETNAPVVFAGFGQADDKSGLNEIEDLDMKNKIVILMTGTPSSILDGSDKDEIFADEESTKITRVLMKGAKAVLFVYNPSSSYRDAYQSGIDEMSDNTFVNAEGTPVQGIPLQAGFITQAAANLILCPSGQTLAGLEKKILETGKSASFEVPGVSTALNTSLVADKFKCRNVIGVIEGSDPVLKNEYVIYSAHFDHTGITDGEINNGADDNASGSMALLEIASAFMKLKKKPERSIVFAWMNAEELGLVGSKYYAKNPVFPLEKTLLDINLDMVGRSKLPSDTGKIFGTELSVTGPRELEYYSKHENSTLDRMAEESAAAAGIKLIDKGNDLEWGSSDHMSFREKGVVAVMFHSGIHADLHEPSDDIEKIDFDKMERSAKMCFLLGYKVADSKAGFLLE